jgi:hypothetical protein
MASSKDAVLLQVDGHEVRVSSPEKPYFAERGIRKIDVVEYFVAVGGGILHALRDRPTTLERWPAGCSRARGCRPGWTTPATPSTRSGCPRTPRVGADGAHHLPQRADGGRDRAGLGGRRRLVREPRHADVPPVAGLEGGRRVAGPDPHRPRPAAGHRLLRRRLGGAARAELLAEFGMQGWPKTSGGAGVHIYVPIQPRWTFTEVRTRSSPSAASWNGASPTA